jgi:DNA-binding PadR family transcriptional regulator
MSKPATFEITKYFVLLALAKEPAHGYAIAGQIVADSVGGVYLRPSTLYFTLNSLERAGLIEQWGISDISAARKIYRLTDAGSRRLADQARMHDHAAGLAKRRLGPALLGGKAGLRY